MKTIKEVRDFLNDIEDINFGGCGISALALYRWIKKNVKKEIHLSFRYMYRTKNSFYMDNERFLKGKKNFITSASHITLNYGKSFFDCTKRKPKELLKRYPISHNNMCEEQLILSLNKNAWNKSFDRTYYIGYIAKHLDIDLSDVQLKFKK